jgi:hypothetical protein
MFMNSYIKCGGEEREKRWEKLMKELIKRSSLLVLFITSPVMIYFHCVQSFEMSSVNLFNLREDILNDLQKSVEALLTSLQTAQDKRNGQALSVLFNTFTWAVELGRKATSDLRFFWENTNRFSTNVLPEYLNVQLYQFTSGEQSGSKFNTFPIIFIVERRGALN